MLKLRSFILIAAVCYSATATHNAFADSKAPKIEPDHKTVPVRPEDTDLEEELLTGIDNFRSLVNARKERHHGKPAFSAELLSANSNRGSALLSENALRGAILELDRLKALGIRAVSMKIGFPVLYRPYHRTFGHFKQYRNFYRDISRAVRDRGMQLVIDSSPTFSDETYSSLPGIKFFYRKIKNFDSYVDARARHSASLVKEFRPDYITVGAEPDTEESQTGQRINTPLRFATLVTEISRHIERLRRDRTTKIGAGIGTWQENFASFTTALSNISQLDFIDIHVYPVVGDYLTRLFAIEEIARNHKKQLAMSEAWLYKARKNELTSVTNADIFARDNYQQWEQLDSLFLATMVDYAKVSKLEFFNPFWSKLFHSYAPADTAHEMSYSEITKVTNKAATNNMLDGYVSALGYSYWRFINDGNPVDNGK